MLSRDDIRRALPALAGELAEAYFAFCDLWETEHGST